MHAYLQEGEQTANESARYTHIHASRQRSKCMQSGILFMLFFNSLGSLWHAGVRTRRLFARNTGRQRNS